MQVDLIMHVFVLFSSVLFFIGNLREYCYWKITLGPFTEFLCCCPTSPVRWKHRNIFGECCIHVSSSLADLYLAPDTVPFAWILRPSHWKNPRAGWSLILGMPSFFHFLDHGTWDGDGSLSYLKNEGVGKGSLLGDGFAMTPILPHVLSFVFSFLDKQWEIIHISFASRYHPCFEASTFFLHVLLWNFI